ncbi:MAG: HAMP domain-containing histidine kinase [Gammaproteobacteria bacterium]|nr:HAMP domain-containing histidine kinase [Gammaproteobacteria bacterium]MBV9620687.1 HAMP domain-containing histidine kinase [Gammaproteobacteria bacterium]
MRLNLFHTTAFRLSAGYTLLLTLAVGVTLGSAYLLTGRLVTAEVDLIIDTELKSLEDKFARGGIAGLTEEINLRADSWGRIGAVYLLADPAFERLAGNVTEWPFEGLPSERYPEFEIETIEPGRRALHPVRAALRRLPGGDLLLVGTDISQGRGFAEQFRIATLWGVGLSTLAAALAGFWFSFRLARRVGEVAETCQRIMAGEAGRRLPLAGARDEFDALAGAVNGVLDRLEEQARTLRATFDSAAHDLRAPLHRLRTRLEALLRASPALEPPLHESLEAGLREIEHLQRTLATLLQIALAESGAAPAAAAAVDLAQLTAELAELFEPVAATRGLTLASELQGPAVVQGNRQLLAQLLTNLIENGLKYVPSGGRIELAVRSLAGAVRLSVSDNGPGIDPANRARAGQPFVRFGAAAAEEGSGLGLSLVAAIVRLHRGRLELQGNDPGLRVLVELPASA